MCKALDIPLLVMDVEGTDGRERGEDQVSIPYSINQILTYYLQDFERKSALFSLAASSVLLINMWEHQVGLYQGANMGLLKTVMEVNFSMFIANSNSELVCLIFSVKLTYIILAIPRNHQRHYSCSLYVIILLSLHLITSVLP